MNMLQTLRALSPIDLRSVWRDKMLSWMIFLPILGAIILRVGLPPLAARLRAQYAFDLEPWYPLFLSYFFVVMTPAIFGIMIGFLLLDEKDDQTLKALQVTPLSLRNYLAYRIAIPVVLTIAMMFILFPLSALDDISIPATFLTAIAAAPIAPALALFMAALAQNKVQGFALMKLTGVVLIMPIFAFIGDGGWEVIFMVIPTYWPMKSYLLLSDGQITAAWPYLIAAVVYPAIIIWLFGKRFNRIMVE